MRLLELVTSSSEGRRASWRERAAPISGDSAFGVGVAAAGSSAADGASAAVGRDAAASATGGDFGGGGGGGGFLGLAASGESVGPAESA